MPSCDICGEEFDTERGLHIHQSQKHDSETEEKEKEEEEAVEEDDSSSEEIESSSTETEGDTDEVVKEIEKETAGGLLGGFSRPSIFVGGAFVGIALGLVVGLLMSQGAGFDKVNPNKVEQSVESLPGANIDVSTVTEKSGVYEVNATVPSPVGGNQTQTVAHVSLDNKWIFLQGTTFKQLRDRLERVQQRQPRTRDGTGGNSTPEQNSPSDNQTR